MLRDDLDTLRGMPAAGEMENLTEEQKTLVFELRVYPEEWPEARLKRNAKAIREMAASVRKTRAERG